MNIVSVVQVRILRPGEEPQDDVLRLPEQHSPRYYAALRDFIEPLVNGAMEHVRVWSDFHGTGRPSYGDMFVNENGHLVGLPRNEAATSIYRANVMEHLVPPPDPEDLPWIAGNAVLTSRRVWF